MTYKHDRPWTALESSPTDESKRVLSYVRRCISSFVFSMSNGSIFDHGHLQGTQGTVVASGKTVGGESHAASYLGAPLKAVAEAPPASQLLQQHSWSFADLPTWESDRVLDVSAVYGATPQWVNATDDDGARIQQVRNARARSLSLFLFPLRPFAMNIILVTRQTPGLMHWEEESFFSFA